jgi:hypothetical protein
MPNFMYSIGIKKGTITLFSSAEMKNYSAIFSLPVWVKHFTSVLLKPMRQKPYFMYSIWIQRHYKPYSCWHKLLLFFFTFFSLSQSFTAVLLRHIHQCQTLCIPFELKYAKILFLLAKLKKNRPKKNIRSQCLI